MEMTIRRCPSCQTPYLEDVDLCPCLPGESPRQYIEHASGTGKIYSFTRVHVAPEEFQEYRSLLFGDH